MKKFLLASFLLAVTAFACGSVDDDDQPLGPIPVIDFAPSATPSVSPSPSPTETEEPTPSPSPSPTCSSDDDNDHHHHHHGDEDEASH